MQHYWKWAHPLSVFHTAFALGLNHSHLKTLGNRTFTKVLSKTFPLPHQLRWGSVNTSTFLSWFTSVIPAAGVIRAPSRTLPHVSTQPRPSTLSQPPWPRVFPCTSRSDCLHLTPPRDLSPRCLPRLFGYQQIALTESPNEVLIPSSDHSAEPGGVPWDRPEKTDARIPSDV